MEGGMCLAHRDGVFCGYCERCMYLWKCQRSEEWGDKSHNTWAMKNYIRQEERKGRVKIERRKLKEEIDRKIEGKILHRHWTIGLPLDYELGKLREKIEELVDEGFYGFRECCGVIEYHSKEKPDGGNIHVHILEKVIGKTWKPSRQIKDLAKFFEVEKNFVDWSPGKTEEDFSNRLNYIYGRKVDAEKRMYVERDRIWREENLLPAVTSNLSTEIQRTYLREAEQNETI